MIYTIYPCPVSFCPSVSFCPLYDFAPLSFCPPPPGNLLMIYAIYPCHVSFCPLDSFCPHIILSPIILPPGNLLVYTIFPFPYHFAPYHFPPYHFAPPPPWKLFHDLHYLPMSSIILPPGLILKSPLQQKLMTGAHPVTVAPLVIFGLKQNGGGR